MVDGAESEADEGGANSPPQPFTKWMADATSQQSPTQTSPADSSSPRRCMWHSCKYMNTRFQVLRPDGGLDILPAVSPALEASQC